MVDARSGLSRCSALLTAALLLHLLLATTADATSLAGSPSPGPRAVGLPVLPLVAPGAAARAPPANTTAAAPGVSPVQARQPAPAAVAKAVPKPAAAAASVNGTPVATVAEAPAAIGSRGELRIGCIVPLTGSKANTGRAVQAAVEMAIRDVGAKKLPGVNIVLTCEDTKCTDVPALYGSQKLARSKVDVMVGEVCSSASLGALGVVNKYQIPLVSPASTAPALSIKGDYFFRTVPSDKYQGQFAARRMIALGAKTVVIASSSDSYGQELAYNFIAAFTRDGGKAFNVEVPAQAPNKNASDIVDAVRARSANGVFIATNDLAWGADIIKALRTAQPPLSAVTIFGGDSLMDATVPLRIGAALAKGVRGSDVTFGSPAFVAAFKTYTAGKNISYVPKASHAYDAAEALIEAYRRAEAPKDGKAILAQLADVRFKGVSGPIAFNEFGDLKYDPKGPRLYTVTEFGADGSIAVVRGE